VKLVKALATPSIPACLSVCLSVCVRISVHPSSQPILSSVVWTVGSLVRFLIGKLASCSVIWLVIKLFSKLSDYLLSQLLN
jgi:hypothetical protein